MIHAIREKTPSIHGSAFVAWNAEVAGDVVLGEGASVWFSATIRGDVANITVGKGTNIQDNAALHGDSGMPCVLGEDCTVGHGAIVHAARIGDRSLIGMGSIILSGAVIGKECVVGAGALVTEGKTFPDRSLIIGSPAKAIRSLTDEDVSKLKASAEHYREKAREAKTEYREIR